MSTQKSVVRHGQGKSNGYRTLVALKIDGKAFFVYGFAINNFGWFYLIKNYLRQIIMMGKDFKELSPLELIHNPANGLNDFGSIDGKTMRQYDDDIKRVWLKNKVSQTLFAKLPNVSISTVKQWELGKRHPHGSSLKLLNCSVFFHKIQVAKFLRDQ